MSGDGRCTYVSRGKYILVAGREVWCANRHGGREWTVDTGSRYGPVTFSPDGNLLALSAGDCLWIIRLDGTIVQRQRGTAEAIIPQDDGGFVAIRKRGTLDAVSPEGSTERRVGFPYRTRHDSFSVSKHGILAFVTMGHETDTVWMIEHRDNPLRRWNAPIDLAGTLDWAESRPRLLLNDSNRRLLAMFDMSSSGE